MNRTGESLRKETLGGDLSKKVIDNGRVFCGRGIKLVIYGYGLIRVQEGRFLISVQKGFFNFEIQTHRGCKNTVVQRSFLPDRNT